MARPSPSSTRVATLPNALSLLRLLGVPLFLWLLASGRDGAAIVVLMVGGISDYLDGVLARRWGQVTRVGQLLDPVADRLYILAALLALGYRELVPWEVVGLLVGRDALLAATLPVLARRHHAPLEVTWLGKVATAGLLLSFPLLLLSEAEGDLGDGSGALGLGTLLLATVLYLLTGAGYLARVVRIARGREEGPRGPGGDASQ